MKHLKYNIRVLFGIFALAMIVLPACKDKTSDEDIINQLDQIAKENEASRDTVNVTLRILSYPNNTVAAGATITFHQAGRTLTATTDDAGVAHLKVNRGQGEITFAAVDHATMRATFTTAFNGNNTGENTTLTNYSATVKLLQTSGANLPVSTITGKAQAEIDQTSDTRYQNVPSGTRVYAHLDLAANAEAVLIESDIEDGVEDENIKFSNAEFANLVTFETTVDGNGDYTLTIPSFAVITGAGTGTTGVGAGTNNRNFVDYRLIFDGFTANQKTVINNYADGTDSTGQRNFDNAFVPVEIPTRFDMFSNTGGNPYTNLVTTSHNFNGASVRAIPSNPTTNSNMVDEYYVEIARNNQGGNAYARAHRLVRRTSNGGTYNNGENVTFTLTDVLGNTATVTFTTTTAGTLPPNINLVLGTPAAGEATSPAQTFKVALRPYQYLDGTTDNAGTDRARQAFGELMLGGQQNSSIFTQNTNDFTVTNPLPGQTYVLNVTYGSGVRTRPVQ